MIGEVTAGLASTQATAIVAIDDARPPGERPGSPRPSRTRLRASSGPCTSAPAVPSVKRVPSVGLPRAIVLAGEQAAGDRVVGDDADALLAAQRQELAFDLAEEQVVAGLDGIESHQIPSASLRPSARATW